MDDELLTIEDMAELYKTSVGSIRTAIWRFRKTGREAGFPMPVLVRGSNRWLKSAVMQHLNTLGTNEPAK